jgi:hypothetical protein
LLRDLSYCSGTRPANAAVEFTFDVDFETALVWPDLLFDTASPHARYPAEARAEVLQIIGEVARLLGTRAPKALEFINEHMKTALACRSDAIDGASSRRTGSSSALRVDQHACLRTACWCAEALAHESVAILYKTERDEATSATGRKSNISLSMVRQQVPAPVDHACLWYGLLSLWSQLARSTG